LPIDFGKGGLDLSPVTWKVWAPAIYRGYSLQWALICPDREGRMVCRLAMEKSFRCRQRKTRRRWQNRAHELLDPWNVYKCEISQMWSPCEGTHRIIKTRYIVLFRPLLMTVRQSLASIVRPDIVTQKISSNRRTSETLLLISMKFDVKSLLGEHRFREGPHTCTYKPRLELL
jgi:hypothetical protein